MAGHSKWANIKHRKAAQDSKKAKVFTKLIKEITVAAKEGGGDPSGNPRLRTLLEKGRQANLPIDNVNRAIKKGTGELPGVNYEAHLYEGYGPQGIAVIVEVLSDNKNRSVGEVRHVFNAYQGNLAEHGAVSWMFEKLGVLRLPELQTFTTGAGNPTNLTEDSLLELLLEQEIKDLELAEQFYHITCPIAQLEPLKALLQQHQIKIESAEVEWLPKNSLEIGRA